MEGENSCILILVPYRPLSKVDVVREVVYQIICMHILLFHLHIMYRRICKLVSFSWLKVAYLLPDAQECIEEKAGFHYEELRSCQPEPSLQGTYGPLDIRMYRIRCM